MILKTNRKSHYLITHQAALDEGRRKTLQNPVLSFLIISSPTGEAALMSGTPLGLRRQQMTTKRLQL
jgi:hypothetical protein